MIQLLLVLSISVFAQKRTLSTKQETFFRNLYPEVVAANKLIMKDRTHVLKIDKQISKGDNISYEDVVFLNRIAQKYKVQPVAETANHASLLEVLKKRVDIIPVDMVLAQAAIESGWGTSRFAKEGNNYFGIHCYGKDCGMKPANVAAGSFLVKSYDNRLECVNDYMNMLNTHRAYQHFRDLRYQERQAGEPLSASTLAKGLEKYSERGMEYVSMVKYIADKYVPENISSWHAGQGNATAQAVGK